MVDKSVSNADLTRMALKDLAPTWSNRVPDLSNAYWDQTKVLIASDSFNAVRNEIFDALINRIGLTTVVNMSYNNPLSMFKSGSMEFGDTYQEIATDIVQGQTFIGSKGKGAPEDQFKVWETDPEAAYFKINRQMYYPITVPDVRVRRAFLDSGGLQTLLGSIISKLDGSNTVDEFVYAKKLIVDYYLNQQKPILSTQKIVMPKLSDDPTAEEIRRVIVVLKNAVKSMTFNSRHFNPSSLMQATAPKDLVLIMNYRYTILNEVQNISGLFNPQYNALNIPILDVDDFGEGGEDIVGVICSKSLLDIKMTYQNTTSADNARALYRNYFFHIHQLYKASPFQPAIFLTTK